MPDRGPDLERKGERREGKVDNLEALEAHRAFVSVEVAPNQDQASDGSRWSPCPRSVNFEERLSFTILFVPASGFVMKSPKHSHSSFFLSFFSSLITPSCLFHCRTSSIPSFSFFLFSHSPIPLAYF
jgi:hypothetical protein